MQGGPPLYYCWRLSAWTQRIKRLVCSILTNPSVSMVFLGVCYNLLVSHAAKREWDEVMPPFVGQLLTTLTGAFIPMVLISIGGIVTTCLAAEWCWCAAASFGKLERLTSQWKVPVSLVVTKALVLSPPLASNAECLRTEAGVPNGSVAIRKPVYS